MVFKYILVPALILTLVFSFYIFNFQDPYSKLKKVSDRQEVEIVLGNQHLTVEVVNKPSSRAQGLSNRQEIGANGMLFVLDQRRVPSFWMKQMNFDLDLIWIDRAKVVDVTRAATAPSPSDGLEDLPYYHPDQPVEMVLEVKAGQFEVEAGDELKLVSMLRYKL